MLRDLFLKISKRVQLLEYKTKISISKLRMKYIGQDFLKGYSKRVSYYLERSIVLRILENLMIL